MTNPDIAGPIERFRASVSLALFGMLLELFGGAWDISWHIDEGRESFWSPPHLVLHSGIILVLTSVFLAFLRAGGIRSARRYPALVAVIAATAFQLSSAPFDELWHRMYGVDVTVWSPPHLVLILGGAATALAMASLALAHSPTRLDRVIAIAFFAVAIAGTSTVYAEWEYPNIPRSHESQRRPIWSYPFVVSVTSGALLVAATRSLGPGGAVSAAAGGMAIKLGIMALLLGRESPPFPPPFYLGPALAVEALAYVGRGRSFRRGIAASIVAGIVAAAAYLVSEPIWRSFVPVWSRLMPALAGFWPMVLAGGAIGAVIGYGISRVFDLTRARGSDPTPDASLVLEASTAAG